MADGSRSEDLSEDEHRAFAAEMYARWEAGESKSPLEVEYWGNATSHGKAFTSYVRKWLGRETERKSSQTEEIDRLRSLLRANGISPTEAGDLAEEFRLLAKARESALAAVRIYNDPLAGFRTETFIVLMIIGWNSLVQAILEEKGVDYFVRNEEGRQVLVDGRPKVKETWELVNMAFDRGEHEALRANIDFFLRLRHLIAHRYVPALDLQVASEAQAMLLNFENQLIERFGEQAALGDRLSVPLQLAVFRDKSTLKSLKHAQAALPTDIQAFLSQHRNEVPDAVLRSPEYALQIFFVPVSANRQRSADATVQFLRPEDVSTEIEQMLQKLTVVTKPRRVAVASDDLLRPKEVVRLVAERLPYRFTMDTHLRSWRHFGVRPASTSSEPESTDERYCRWDRLMQGYGYTRGWVEKLVSDLSDADTYDAVVGIRPELI
jgi:hypothetical protein